jgi:hypothetical protein
MKIHGIKIEGPASKTIVFPRSTGNLAFVLQAVLDSDEFDKILSTPKPPVRLLPGGQKQTNIDDPDYRKKMDEWGTAKHHWMFLKAISATPGLEWETVKSDDPKTWTNYEAELIAAGLTDPERLRIMQAYIEVQGLDDKKIEEATNSFLAGLQEAKAEESSLSTAPKGTPSGAPVKG